MTDNAAPHRRFLVIVNKGSGTVRSLGEEAVRAAIETGFSGAGTVDIRFVDGEALVPTIAKAREADSLDAVIVGGGDGSLASAAAMLIGSPIALGVLPLGTMNMVVKSAGISTTLGEAIRQAATGQVRSVDVGQVNGQVFLHQVSFGLQPRVLRIREKIGYRSRITKMLSGAVALAAVMARPRVLRLSGKVDGQPVNLTLPAFAVSNNVYRDDRPSIPARLDGGELGVYMISARQVRDYVRMVLAALRGTWKDDAMVEARHASHVRVEPRRRKTGGRLLASVDGELVYLSAPVDITIAPQALQLIMPPP